MILDKCQDLSGLPLSHSKMRGVRLISLYKLQHLNLQNQQLLHVRVELWRAGKNWELFLLA